MLQLAQQVRYYQWVVKKFLPLKTYLFKVISVPKTSYKSPETSRVAPVYLALAAFSLFVFYLFCWNVIDRIPIRRLGEWATRFDWRDWHGMGKGEKKDTHKWWMVRQVEIWNETVRCEASLAIYLSLRFQNETNPGLKDVISDFEIQKYCQVKFAHTPLKIACPHALLYRATHNIMQKEPVWIHAYRHP